ncbi:MAG TPA: flagellar basal body rod protein FlgB [Rhodocyclaceae bacterium]|nr:flagellar basal body rod protein FlgB [Rhodocyclaceae bacterium]
MADLAERLSVYTQALNVRTQRHQLLASNVANADTPNYKARDIDFSKAMQLAMSGREGGVSLARTASGHLSGNAMGNGLVQFRREVQSAVDGNTVDMDVERAQMAENAMQYEILTKLVGDRIQGMRSAIASNQG